MNTLSLPNSDHSISLKYATAIGASLAASFEADAAVVYSGIQNIRLLNTNTSNSVGTALNVDGIGPVDITLSAFQTITSTSINSTTSYPTYGVGVRVTASLPGGRLAPGMNGGLANLAFGTSISPTLFGINSPVQANPAFLEYASYGANINSGGEFDPTIPGFIGLQFESNGNTHYGWVRLRIDDLDLIQLGGANIADATVIDWAYEDTPGAAISAGAVPEPSALALLALGATGLASVRRRKSV